MHFRIKKLYFFKNGGRWFSQVRLGLPFESTTGCYRNLNGIYFKQDVSKIILRMKVGDQHTKVYPILRINKIAMGKKNMPNYINTFIITVNSKSGAQT